MSGMFSHCNVSGAERSSDPPAETEKNGYPVFLLAPDRPEEYDLRLKGTGCEAVVSLRDAIRRIVPERSPFALIVARDIHSLNASLEQFDNDPDALFPGDNESCYLQLYDCCNGCCVPEPMDIPLGNHTFVYRHNLNPESDETVIRILLGDPDIDILAYDEERLGFSFWDLTGETQDWLLYSCRETGSLLLASPECMYRIHSCDPADEPDFWGDPMDPGPECPPEDSVPAEAFFRGTGLPEMHRNAGV